MAYDRLLPRVPLRPFSSLLAVLLVACGAGTGANLRPLTLDPPPALAGETGAVEARAAACRARVAESPADLRAEDCYRQAMTRLGRGAEVVEAASLLRAAHPEAPLGWYLEVRARHGSEPEAAAKLLKTCLDRFPEDALCAGAQARLLLEDEQPASAVMYLERARAVRPGDADLAAMHADALLALGRVQKARELAEASVKADPASPAAQIALTNAILATGRPSEARAHVERAVELAPDDPAAYLARARWALLVGDRDLARRNLEEAVTADPRAASARELLARVLLRLEKGEGAIAHLDLLLERRPDRQRYMVLMGEAQIATGDPGRALGWAQAALSRDAHNLDALALQARALIGLGEIDAALALRERLYADRDEAPGRRIAIASALAMAGRAGLAESEFAAAVQVHPDVIRGWRAYGRWHGQHGRFRRAAAIFRQAIERHPGAPLLHFDLAHTLDNLGNRKGARAQMAEAARLDPKDPDYEDELARLEFLDGEIALAVQRWERLVGDHPGADRAMLRLSHAHRVLKRPRRAAELLEILVRRHPDDGDLLAALGEVLVLCDEKARAVGLLRDALKLGADRKRLTPLLAAALADTGDDSGADVTFRGAVDEDPGNRALRLTYTRFLESRGRSEEAVAQYRALLARDPTDREAEARLRALVADARGADAMVQASRARPAAQLDPELAALVREAPPPDADRLATVLRDERYVTVDADGIATVRHVRSILLNQARGVERYGEVTLAFHHDHPPKVVRARTLTPDGDVVAVPEASIRTIDPNAGTPLHGDARQLSLTFPRLEPGAIIDYEVIVPRPHTDALNAWWDAYILANLDPTVRVRYVLDLPAGARFAVATPGLEGPEIERLGDRERRTWSAAHLPAYGLGKPARPGDPPIPAAYASSLRSWADVDRWYYGLFAPAAEPGPAVAAKARALTAGLDTRRERIAAIDRFVEQHVRYLGIELGIGAYRPRPAASTLGQAVGDCKDMTALMVALLRAVDIDALPALIRPRDQGLFLPNHPSPGQFSHVLVYVPDPDGDLWLDATAAMGTLDAVPDVLRDRDAFLVDGHGGRLARIPAGEPSRNQLEESVHYHLTPTGGGWLETGITLRGDPAGEVRQRLLGLDAGGRRALLSAPGYLLARGRTPSAVEVKGLEDPLEALRLTARLEHPDLVGVRLDGSLVVPLDLSRAPEGTLPGMGDRGRLGSPRTYVRSLKVSAPAGYALAWSPLRYEHDGPHVHLGVGERRTGAETEITARLVIRGDRLDEGTLRELAASVSEARRELTTELVLRPGPDFDQVAFLRAITDERPEDPRMWRLLGRSLLEQDRVHEALAALERARKLSPESPQVLALLGAALVRADETAQAEAVFRALSKSPKATAEVHMALAALMLADARPKDAVAVLREGVRRFPTHDAIARRLVGALSLAGDGTAALSEAERQAAIRPEDGALQVLLGDLAAAAGKHDLAEQAYRAALDLDTDRTRVLNNLAWMLRQMPSRRAEALQLARRAVHLDPRSDAAWDTLAELFFLTGNPARALDAIERALSLNPKRRTLYEQRKRKYVAARRAGD